MDFFEETWKIKNKYGIHARPARLFVDIASKYDCEIRVKANGMWANGKSIMSIMGLGAPCGEELTVQTHGDDAAMAIAELRELVNERKFDEN
ncbi:HPr family phosphocarrier protein [candidate division KSB1 bacterium]|nr:HPr family phosphocarrier protein [candidate division KSB1 bacterium]